MTDYIGRSLVADALREWRSQLRQHAAVSPLRDLAPSQAQIVDLRGAHPGGLAPLFAGRATAMTQLIREGEAREQALVRARHILDEATRIHAATGAWTAALVVGTVAWDEDGHRRELPLLLRPVGLEAGRDRDVMITLRDEVRVNPVFASELRARGDEETLTEALPRVGAGADFDPRPLWEAVRDRTDLFGDSLEAPERLVLGVFDDPEQRLLSDLDDLDSVIAASDVLVAASGDQDATGALAMPLPAFPVGDRDPFAERGMGDLDDAQFAALDLIATGRHAFLQSPPGSDVVGMSAAIAADGAASGRTVAVVSGTEGVLRDVHDRMVALGAGDLAVNAAVEAWNADARQRLLEAVTLGAPTVDDETLRRQGEELLTARYRLHSRFDALHRTHRPWGVSAFECVQALVRVTTGDTEPRTGVRLGADAGLLVTEHGFAAVSQAIAQRVTGEEEAPVTAPTPIADGPRDAWWRDVAEDAEEGRRFDEALGALLTRHLPKMRHEAAAAAHETGVDEATDLTTWADQVRLFEDVRETLEVFSPAVFHRSLHDLVAATAPETSSKYVKLPRRERKALLRRAIELLRPGRGKERLHEQLLEAHDVAIRWRSHCSGGGWPVVPDDYDLFGHRLDEAGDAWLVIGKAVEQVSGQEDLPSQPWERLVGTLEHLTGGLTAAIEQVPSQPLGVDVEEAGFAELVADLKARDADSRQVRADLEFAWWAAAFDSIIGADPRLAQHGALGEAVTEFRARDLAFGASRVQPLMRAAGERRRGAIARHPELARDLFATLVEGADATYRDLWRDYSPLVAALRPVSLVRAEQVPHMMPPSRVIDVLVVVAAESLALAELVPALARAKQVVVLADAHSATRSAVAALAALLPHVTLPALPQPRDPRVTAVLQDAVYGRTLSSLPAAGEPESLAVQIIDAHGTPVPGLPEVESTAAEVALVVEHLARTVDAIPRRSVVVVAGNPLHAGRISTALAERDSRLVSRVPIVSLGEAAGLSADDVILTWGYARDEDGAYPRRLGVLSEEWGTHALTQALVAGRERTWVFGAIGVDALGAIAERSDEGHGVEMLQDLLDAAARAAVAPERPHPAPSDWLLGDIAHRLRSAGCAVRLRYGSGSDAIPMVVGGQGESGFRLAVVTDEASAAGSASLRDRVRWQHARLEALGWTVLPLWTLDVFMDPEAATRQVLDALSHAEAPTVTASISLPHAAPAPVSPYESAAVPSDTGEMPVFEVPGQDVFDFEVEHAVPALPDEPSSLEDEAATGVVAALRVEEPEPEAEPESDAIAEADPTLGIVLPQVGDESDAASPYEVPETPGDGIVDDGGGAELAADLEAAHDATETQETLALDEDEDEPDADDADVGEGDVADEDEPDDEAEEPEPAPRPVMKLGFGVPKLAPRSAPVEDDAADAHVADDDAADEDAVEAEADQDAGELESDDDADASASGALPAPKVAPRTAGPERPLIPTRAWEDEDAGWGGRDTRSRDDEIKGDRPPHW
ncbi:hypothetical protein [Demequina sp. NBRC 110052]|uniref:hypothetical protein n=1 Tax=Demequina sp. NBRC 110052 TaxID=1570341 RepID=UPI0009FEBAEA|nr:hypothetical protein [Demequina sp. NBRC 110052]